MYNWLRYWDTVVILVFIIVCMAMLAVGCGALVFWLADSFSPMQLGVGAGVFMAAIMGMMFYSAVRE